MKISDLINDLDLFDFGKPKQSSPEYDELDFPNQPDMHEVDPEEDDLTDKTTMVAPLQQKLELLKRAVGVSNMYDEKEEESEKMDELGQILKIAGVPVAQIFDAGDDEPLDS